MPVGDQRRKARAFRDFRLLRVSVNAWTNSRGTAAPPQLCHRRRCESNNEFCSCHIINVSGGPTGIELSGEIFDLIDEDLKRAFPRESREAKVAIRNMKEVYAAFLRYPAGDCH